MTEIIKTGHMHSGKYHFLKKEVFDNGNCLCSAYDNQPVKLYQCVIDDKGGYPCPYTYIPDWLVYSQKKHVLYMWYYQMKWRMKNKNMYKRGE